MGKLLSWIAMGFAIYVAYKVVLALQRKSQLRSERARSDPVQDASKQSDGEAKTAKERMLGAVPLISCAHCRLQLPKSEAVSLAGLSYCSQEHARLGVEPRDSL